MEADWSSQCTRTHTYIYIHIYISIHKNNVIRINKVELVKILLNFIKLLISFSREGILLINYAMFRDLINNNYSLRT
jgi:hypothetical protein